MPAIAKLQKTDPVALTRALIRCPSVTPQEGGALDLLEAVLRDLGFDCHQATRIPRGSCPPSRTLSAIN